MNKKRVVKLREITYVSSAAAVWRPVDGMFPRWTCRQDDRTEAGTVCLPLSAPRNISDTFTHGVEKLNRYLTPVSHTFYSCNVEL